MDHKVFIISYELAAKRGAEIKKLNFKMCIADEVHYLKSKDTKRTRALLPLLQASKRVILLSGTPVLAKPVEIHNVLTILRPDIVPNFKEFTRRYCDPKQNFFGMDYSGAQCTSELHYILNQIFMIRRLKNDVLS